MEAGLSFENDLNLKATELTLGLPGNHETEEQSLSTNVKNKKRWLSNMKYECGSKCLISESQQAQRETSQPAKTQIVGWPPVRSYRKNVIHPKKTEAEIGGIYVKVSMDGAPYLRKIDLKVYKDYAELLKALENMFKFTVGEYSEREGYKGSEYVPTYEDKDGDWMLVGDVPWNMFISSCKRMRIMKGSEARGLGCGV